MQKDDVRRLLRDPQLIPSEKQTLLSDIASQAAALNMPCYVVGGFVRDLLLHMPVNDLDIIVEGDAIKLGNVLVQKFGGRLTAHQKFRTAIWHLPSTLNAERLTLDLITARKETYAYPGALPTVELSTMDDDLHRRDFTINAMAIRLDGDYFGEILDPLNGRQDLNEKVLRVLHPQSFIDDPTRIFRALRYEARYQFILYPSSFSLINPESLAVLSKLSGERIRHELDLIFDEKNISSILLRAANLGLLKFIHPRMPEFNQDYAEFLEMEEELDVPADRRTLGYIFWFIDLSEEDVLSISNRLDFTNELTLSVWSAAQLKRSLPHLVGSEPSIWTYALEKLPLLSIYAVYLVTREKSLLNYISLWRHVKPHTTGNDLKARGLPPGPRFGEILEKLRAAWLDGVLSSHSEEEKLLEELLSENS